MSNVVIEEAKNEQQIDSIIMMREMRREMNAMKRKYEDELKVLHVENAFIRQDMG